jgi:predicted small lipoprotein YifL
MKASRATLMISFVLLSAACGRKGPLIYPDMLVPAAPAVLSGQQSGAAVQIQFVLPDRDRSGRPLAGVAGAKVSRMATEADRMEVCRSCLSDYLPLRTLYLDHLPTDTQRFGSLLIMRDGEVKAGSSYSYRVVPFTADGTDGAPATISGVSVIPPFAGPDLKAESFPTEIRLQCIMQPPASGQLLGCNLYRSAGPADRVFQPLNRQPLPGGEYVDTALQRGVKYRYAARALLQVATGAVVESLDSVEVEGMLKDDE